MHPFNVARNRNVGPETASSSSTELRPASETGAARTSTVRTIKAAIVGSLLAAGTGGLAYSARLLQGQNGRRGGILGSGTQKAGRARSNGDGMAASKASATDFDPSQHETQDGSSDSGTAFESQDAPLSLAASLDDSEAQPALAHPALDRKSDYVIAQLAGSGSEQGQASTRSIQDVLGFRPKPEMIAAMGDAFEKMGISDRQIGRYAALATTADNPALKHQAMAALSDAVGLRLATDENSPTHVFAYREHRLAPAAASPEADFTARSMFNAMKDGSGSEKDAYRLFDAITSRGWDPTHSPYPDKMISFAEQGRQKLASMAARLPDTADARQIHHSFGKPFVPNRVIHALSQHNPDWKNIAVHRGLYDKNCPENSFCSVENAVQNGFPAVEIDVKDGKDGTPWPSHDMTAGRNMDVRDEHGELFSPYEPLEAQKARNPDIASLTDKELSILRMRDKDGNVTEHPVVPITTLLSEIKEKTPNIAVIIDIKTANSARKCAEAVEALGMQDSTILKFGVGVFSPEELTKETKSLSFSSTVYAGDLDKIYKKMGGTGDPNKVVNEYLEKYTKLPGFTYFEVGAKEFLHDGKEFKLAGPLAEAGAHLASKGVALGNFIPVIEHEPDERSGAVGFYHGDGHCCTQLDQFYTNTEHFGREKSDDRPDLETQMNVFDNILTDDAIKARDLATASGKQAGEYRLME